MNKNYHDGDFVVVVVPVRCDGHVPLQWPSRESAKFNFFSKFNSALRKDFVTLAVAKRLERVRTSAAVDGDGELDAAGGAGAADCCETWPDSLAGLVNNWASVGAKFGLIRLPDKALCRMEPAEAEEAAE